jgi:AmiR/NasT family two-component response regulator
MTDYLDHLSEGLTVLHDVLQSEDSRHAAPLLPATASVRADTTRLVQELTKALESRAVIEQAKGMLMTRLAYDADEAFDLLDGVSRDSNEKMLVVAQRMVKSAVKARQN